MNARIATYHQGLSFRQILALDIFRWNLKLGFAIAPRDMSDLRHRRRKQVRLSDVPSCLRDDVGLPQDEDRIPFAATIWHHTMK